MGRRVVIYLRMALVALDLMASPGEKLCEMQTKACREEAEKSELRRKSRGKLQ